MTTKQPLILPSPQSSTVPTPSFLVSSTKVASSDEVASDASLGYATQNKSTTSSTGSSRGSGKSTASSLSKRRTTGITEVERLEFENRKMEERLVALKETLSKQKEKRGTTESIWKGGNLQRGSLKSYADDVLLAKKLAKERQKQANLRYSGISDEAATQLRSFEDEVAARLMKLQSLHSQSTGHAGLPSDLSLIVKPASKLDAGSQSNVEKPLKKYGDTKLANEAFKNEKDETIIEKANTPVPPKETPKMWQISIDTENDAPSDEPMHPKENDNDEGSSKPNNEMGKSFLSSLQSWTAAAATAAEVPSSKNLPNGPPTTPFRIRRSRLRYKSPPPQPQEVEEVVTEFHNLADGKFDEKESHNSFVQALNAWRKDMQESEIEENGGKLFDGEYDEQESRSSFLKTLESWRRGDDKSASKFASKPPDENIGTSTQDSFVLKHNATNVLADTLTAVMSSRHKDTNNSLSYLDKLLLARLRSHVASPVPQSQQRSQIQHKIEDDDSAIEDYSAPVFWPSNASGTDSPSHLKHCQKRFDQQPQMEIEMDFEVLSTSFELGGYERVEFIVAEPEDSD